MNDEETIRDILSQLQLKNKKGPQSSEPLPKKPISRRPL